MAPEVTFTVATPVLLLPHDPPASPLLEYVIPGAPIQIGEVPDTVPALASGLTVKSFVAGAGALQPVTV